MAFFLFKTFLLYNIKEEINMPRKKTPEEFEKEFNEKFNGEYTLLSEYINANNYIKVRHEKCGYEYKVKVYHIMNNNRRCPNCYGNIKGTLEGFKEKVKNMYGNEYSVLGNEYINNKTEILMKHNKCGHEYLVRPDYFIGNRKCPKCANELRIIDKRLNPEDFKNSFYNLVGNEYTLLSDYINTRTKINIKHNTCGNIFEMCPNNFTNGSQRCPKCFGTPKKTLQEIKEKFFKLVGDEYEILSKEYTNNKEKLLVKHNIETCNCIYEVSANKFISLGRRCPQCRESKGEKAIAKFLEDKAEFERQYTFPDCKYIDYLRFDFKLEDIDEEGNLNKIILIEFDGIQHYEPTFGEEAFKLQQTRDNIKNEYCKTHDNIDLYRIPYWDIDNIPKILTEILEKYNS